MEQSSAAAGASSAIDYGDSDNDPGFQVNEPVEVGDLSEQQGGVLEAAQRVGFIIRKATVRTQEDKDTKQWSVKRLSVEAAIGPLGVDGEGKFANKVLFPEFVLTFNSTDFPEKFASNWWQKEARYPLIAVVLPLVTIRCDFTRQHVPLVLV